MPRVPSPTTEDTPQAIVNLSFDADFEVLVAEMLGYDGADLVRVAVTSDGKLKIA